MQAVVDDLTNRLHERRCRLGRQSGVAALRHQQRKRRQVSNAEQDQQRGEESLKRDPPRDAPWPVRGRDSGRFATDDIGGGWGSVRGRERSLSRLIGPGLRWRCRQGLLQSLARGGKGERVLQVCPASGRRGHRSQDEPREIARPVTAQRLERQMPGCGAGLPGAGLPLPAWQPVRQHWAGWSRTSASRFPGMRRCGEREGQHRPSMASQDLERLLAARRIPPCSRNRLGPSSVGSLCLTAWVRIGIINAGVDQRGDPAERGCAPAEIGEVHEPTS